MKDPAGYAALQEFKRKKELEKRLGNV
jgi:hypothetical protein